jgi:hypothetical protein
MLITIVTRPAPMTAEAILLTSYESMDLEPLKERARHSIRVHGDATSLSRQKVRRRREAKPL